MSAAAEKSDQTKQAKTIYPRRPISFGDIGVTSHRRDDGTIYVRPTVGLGEYPVRITDCLHRWAKETPDRVFMAERARTGGWREVTYVQMLDAARHIASALLARGLSAEKPIVI